MSKDFFNRKEGKKIELPNHPDYDKSNFENDLLACGINDIEGFQARHSELFGNLIVDSEQVLKSQLHSFQAILIKMVL